tara:strand:- start:1495 stop:2223 length:729 start_codon:yes stop_codon:yes gene_type:complete
MVYSSVLTDLAIKQAHPESFPLDISSSIDNHDPHLPTHPFRGIKLPRNIKNKKTVARYPINDIKNMTTFLNPLTKHQTQFREVMEYRKKFDSANVPQNLEIAYDQRLKMSYEPILQKTPSKQQIEMSSGTPSASITLFKHSKHEDVSKFDEANPEYTTLLTARSKATLYNMADEKDHHHLLKVLFPQEKNMKMLTDSDFKRTLSSYYRDSPSNIDTINKAYQQSTPHLDTKKIFPKEEEIEE